MSFHFWPSDHSHNLSIIFSVVVMVCYHHPCQDLQPLGTSSILLQVKLNLLIFLDNTKLKIAWTKITTFFKQRVSIIL